MSSVLELGPLQKSGTSPIKISPNVKRLVMVLIKPTSYDDNGFPHRYWRGVLPSNSSAVLYTLSQEATRILVPPDIQVEMHMLEDGLWRHAKKLEKLLRRFPEPGTKLIVCFVAVQTAQFPRACDLIDRWQSVGATCVIGGFHVSGSITMMLDGVEDKTVKDVPCPHVMPPEIQVLMDKGVVVFHGEAELVWREALGDILADKQRTLYRGGKPPLNTAPLPDYPLGYFKKNFVTRMGTFDTSRGCPFVCSFCTIIWVQGRTPRYRDPQAIIDRVREICDREGKVAFFIVDDNYGRNPRWEEILDGLIALREQGYQIHFMIEADLACGKIKGFIEKLGRAGCGSIFMGVESVNPVNLSAAGKAQNKVENYEELWQLCHDNGIMVHAAYIIGFPNDTPESVLRDVETLARLGADQVSFFMLTLLPGSEDHARAVAAGIAIDPDLSKCDSFHATFDHPRMSRDEWIAVYRRAWREFYRPQNMVTALKRCLSRTSRLNLFRNYVWYRWSALTERTHPMIAGFYRFRPYRDRRPSAASLPYWKYLLQEGVRHLRYFRRLIAEFYIFQHVLLETEPRVAKAAKREEWGDRLDGVGDWFRYTFGPNMTRRWLNRFWRDYARNRWHLLINPIAYRWHLWVLPHAVAEAVYTFRFAVKLPRLIKTTTR